ncbi:hypothetical protein LAZ67_15001528 [Cordylochernes scorpioides]|uniref:Reverse transcriptase domain-containing protein n=1 Tax=Cordylochernes scorpioides TaxID=51811 RepID=A0ABY6L8V0_9ARAC|nr:hypothetical protein LAZ67_15001528 [Cordylochernes scorpioides]
MIISGIEVAISKLNTQEKEKIRQKVSRTLNHPPNQPLRNPREKHILRNLKNRKEIVITQADKGGTTVIMNKTEYQNKMENILKDSTTFEPLTDTERNQVYLNIKKDINRLKKSKIITEDEHKAFLNNSDSEAHIYGKPKLHKQNIPLRPIVAFYLSPIAPIAKFLTKFLQPLVRTHTPTQSIANIPTFIQEILNTNIENHHLIVSFDVEALYPSLPHQLILENTKSLLIENRLDQTVINKIIELIDTVKPRYNEPWI